MTEIERINEFLIREYGMFNGFIPNWRVVWSEDQFEKRKITHTREGLELLYPQVENVPKYRQHIHFKYVLERCLAIPQFVETDLVDKFSYEPIWVFQDSKGNALPPRIDACKLVVEQVYAAASRSIGAKYKDPEIGTPEEIEEVRRARIAKLQEELFGDESDTADALHYGEGIAVPSNYHKDKGTIQ